VLGPVGVFIDMLDQNARDGEHSVDVDQWVRWDDGEVGVKTVPVTILDHDPTDVERSFVVAMNGTEPPSLGDAAIFEYDDQIDVSIPGICSDGESPPETTVVPTTTAPPTTVPAPVGVSDELPETGNGSGLIASVSTLLVLLGATMLFVTRRGPRSVS
jgi:hypothetical protein